MAEQLDRRPPDLRLLAKLKRGDGKRIRLAGVWRNERGFRVALDRDVQEIVMKDGSVLTAEDCYFDLFEERGQGQGQQQRGARPSSRDEWARGSQRGGDMREEAQTQDYAGEASRDDDF